MSKFNFKSLVLILFCIAVLFPAGKASALSVDRNLNIYSWQSGDGSCEEGGWGSTALTLTYVARLYNDSTGGNEIPSGANVPGGTILRVVPVMSNDGVNYYVTGGCADSPFGYWYDGPMIDNFTNVLISVGSMNEGIAKINELANGQISTSYGDGGRTISGAYYLNANQDVIVKKPSISYYWSGGGCNGITGNSCTTTTAGTVTASINFAATYAGQPWGMAYPGVSYVIAMGYFDSPIPSATITFNVNVTSNACAASNAGQACYPSNSCGQANTGTIQCDSSCSVSVPAMPSGYGNACTSSANACGTTSSGTISCDGTCSAGTPPPPASYGNACTSAANACGSTNSGTINCSGACTASAPANPANYGSACSLTSSANTCGQTTSANTGTYNCSGACTGTPPAAPAVTIPGGNTYGSACTSPANACGQTQANGTWQCNGSCSSTAPANTSCPSDLTAATPTVSPSSLMSVGQSVTLSSLISNIASGPANGSFHNIFRINTSSLISGSSINGLGAGASANTTASYTPTSSGTYTVSACTDNNTSWQGSIAESNEGNNCSANISFTTTACTESLTSTPSTIEQGQSSVFSWSPSSSYCGFTSCTFADGASYGGASGSRTVSPSTTSTYGLSCIGPYNPSPGTPSTYSTITVLVPTATISVSPQRVPTGTNTTVSWSSTNSTSCTGTNFSTGGATSGSVTRNVTTQTIYTVNCVNNHNTHATASATVNVIPLFNEF